MLEILASALSKNTSVTSSTLFELCNDEFLFNKPEQMKEAMRELVDHKVFLIFFNIKDCVINFFLRWNRVFFKKKFRNYKKIIIRVKFYIP